MTNKALITLVTAALLTAGCGGSGGPNTMKSLAQLQDRMAKGGVACEGKPGPYQSHGDDFSFGIADPVEALECETPDGVEVEASRWNTSKELDAALELAGSMVCSFGGDSAFVRTDATVVSITGDTMTKDDYATLEQIAKSLGTDITEPCDDKIDRATLADSSGELGKPVDLGDGTTITLSDPRVAGDEQPHIEVEISFMNDSSTTAQAPLPAIACDGAKDPGGWLAGSEYDAYDDVKPGKTLSGMAQLLVPGDDRIGDATPECPAPAFFVVEPNGPKIPVPGDVLDEFNEQARESVDHPTD